MASREARQKEVLKQAALSESGGLVPKLNLIFKFAQGNLEPWKLLDYINVFKLWIILSSPKVKDDMWYISLWASSISKSYKPKKLKLSEPYHWGS
jgi:hypothetical protein